MTKKILTIPSKSLKKKYVEDSQWINLTHDDNGVNPSVWIKEIKEGIARLKEEGCRKIKVRLGDDPEFVYDRVEEDYEYKKRIALNKHYKKYPKKVLRTGW